MDSVKQTETYAIFSGRVTPILGCLVALAAGVLTTLSAAPFYLWWLGPVAVGLVYWKIHALTPAMAALRGWCYGVGLFGAGTSWVFVAIHDYSDTGAPLALLLTILFVAVLALFFAVPFGLYRRLTGPRLAFLSFAGVWVVSEWLRTWLFTGFPWLLLGTSQIDSPLAPWAPIGGVYLLSLITALTGTLGVELLRRRWWFLVPIAVMWLVPLVLPNQWTTPAGEPIHVALLQGNLDQNIKWSAQGQRESINIYTSMTREQPSDIDLIVWPEVALPLFEQEAQLTLERVASDLSPGTNLLTGILQRDGEGLYYNSVIGLGDVQGQYRKAHLVPFGEYLPLKSLLAGTIAFFDLPTPSMTPGPGEQPPIHVAGTSIGNAICYEIIFADRLAQQARHAELLLTVSNDTWFGRSIGPHQHLQMARLRALENGRSLIRATSNGVTALIDSQGRITASAPQFEKTSLTGEVTPMQGLTPFTRTGSGPAWLLAALLTLLGLQLNVSRSQDNTLDEKE
ncbi:apolipoprotein N-acyltransferase [Vreelandella titanicae]|uniref:apolipoprotein N-acyltransferase n=1 Tax=Vreelandella titanicae TaxID=664683 RepID=UPI00034B9915|nr:MULTISPECIES: apolipoprotein N-acyltransferase [Halomonas]MBF58588.1 apolipoprotein N-acyltransferase [Halomonas sp.]MBR9903386.1 apolipoprotein N-acyltransferase [Gammaproteobacteria bacterium]QNU63133.1 apolipoprotein N-acyltransferase [Halomonas titanicae]|tara:strand:+ start:11679 stop:13208 length:1530 start_codon:yes stop_codon:yes gene_type:complete